MADLKPCDPDIFENGLVVCVRHGLNASRVELWVQRIAEVSQQRVDWHYDGGRVVVRALGNIDKVNLAIAVVDPDWRRLVAEMEAERALNEAVRKGADYGQK